MKATRHPARKGARIGQLIPIVEDRSAPISIWKPTDVRSELLQESDTAFNRFALSEREVHGRRTKVRLSFEVYARRKNGGLGMIRLRGSGVILNCPDSTQAELAIKMLEQVAAAMAGKHLTQK